MDPKLTNDSDFVRQMSAHLRAASPYVFAPEAMEVTPRSVPTPASQPAREEQPTESVGLSAILAPLDEALRAQQAAAAEEARRLADPDEQRLAQLERLATQILNDEVIEYFDDVDGGSQ